MTLLLVITFFLSLFQVSFFTKIENVLIIISIILYMKSYFNKKIKVTKKSVRPFLLILTFCIVIVFQLTYTKDFTYSVDFLKNLIYIMIVSFLLFSIGNYKSILRYLVKSIVYACIIHNLIGWFEVIFHKYYFAPEHNIMYYSYRGFPVSTFYNTNNFAIFLSIALVFICLDFSISKTVINKSLDIITILSSILLIIQSDSRGALYSCFISLGVYLLIRLTKVNINITRLIFDYIVVITTMIVITLNFSKITNLFIKEKSIESNDTRINLLKNGYYFLKESKYFGIGIGNLENWLENRQIYNTGGVFKMHNMWMEILVTYGVLLFLAFAICYFLTIIYFFKKINSSEKIVKNASRAIVIFLVSFTVGSTTPSSIISEHWIWSIFVFVFVNYLYISNSIKEKRSE